MAKSPLKDWANELLDEKMIDSQQYLLSSQIRKKWNEHLSKNMIGQNNYGL